MAVTTTSPRSRRYFVGRSWTPDSHHKASKQPLFDKSNEVRMDMPMNIIQNLISFQKIIAKDEIPIN